MVAEYLSKSWDAYKRNFWQIVGGLLLVSLAVFVIILLTGMPLFIKIISLFAASSVMPSFVQIISDGGVQSLIVLFMAGIAVAIIAGTALEAGLVKMFADALKGKAEIGTIIAVAREKFWTILGADVLAGLIRVALFLVFVLPPFMAMLYGAVYNVSNPLYVPNIATMLWFYGGLIAYMLVVLPFTLVNQAVVVGNRRAVDSVKKSFFVVKENYLQFLGLTVLVSLIAVLVSIVPVLGSLANFFAVTPIAGLAYTAFYLAKAGESGRAAIGKRGTAKRRALRGRKRKRSR